MNILVIGGSRGIGKAIAKNLAQDGNQVLVVGRNKDTLDSLVAEAGDNISTFIGDITYEQDRLNLVHYVENSFELDGIVLSAAKFPNQDTKTSVTKPSVHELEEMLNANVVANYRIVQLLFDHLKTRNHPRIVIIGSTSGVRQDKGGIYGISKWALSSFAYNLRDECKQYGIGVSLINPGATCTEVRKKKSEDDETLLESNDFGILVSALFRMSPHAVIERADVRPVLGDTY